MRKILLLLFLLIPALLFADEVVLKGGAKFTGKITKLRFDLAPSQYTEAEQEKAAEAVARAKD